MGKLARCRQFPILKLPTARMKALSDIGLELSITGGITPADLPLFREINVKAFIAGRALAGAQNPAQVAGEFHAQIDAIWGTQHA